MVICNIFQSVNIYILNSIALIFPAHVRWEGARLSHPVAQLHDSRCGREENTR